MQVWWIQNYLLDYNAICPYVWVVLLQFKEKWLLLTLYISTAKIWIFLLWMETQPSFFSNVSYSDSLTKFIVIGQRSCNLFILWLLARLWHIHQEAVVRRCCRPRHATLLKKKLWHSCFPVNFVKLLRTPFSQNNSARLLL